jgi:hypothetical protein
VVAIIFRGLLIIYDNCSNLLDSAENSLMTLQMQVRMEPWGV